MPHTSVLKKNNVTVLNPAGSETIVFCHGFGTDQSAWRYIQGAFPEYRLVLFDNVGSGKSDPELYSSLRYSRLESYAHDLLDIISELDLQNIIYIGHSVGGMIGLLAAKLEPQRFGKMVFIGASPRYLNDTDYVGGFREQDLESLFTAMETNYYAWASGFAPLAMHNPDKPSLAQEFAGTLNDIRPDIAVSVAKVIFRSDYRAELPDFNTPVLIIQGNEDVAVPLEVAQYLSANIKNSQMVVVNAYGHLPHISAPNAVTKAIKAYL